MPTPKFKLGDTVRRESPQQQADDDGNVIEPRKYDTAVVDTVQESRTAETQYRVSYTNPDGSEALDWWPESTLV